MPRASKQFIDKLKPGTKVGVLRNGRNGAHGRVRALGTVERITPSRAKIVVKASNGHEYEFNKDGEIRGGTWDPTTYLVEPTREFVDERNELLRSVRARQLGAKMAKSHPPGMTDGMATEFNKALATLEGFYAALDN